MTRARNPLETSLIALFCRSFLSLFATGTFFCQLFLFLELLSVFSSSSCGMKWNDRLQAVLMQLWWTSENSSTRQQFGRYCHFAKFLQDEVQPRSVFFVGSFPRTMKTEDAGKGNMD